MKNQFNYKPSTITEKLRRVRKAMQFIMYNKEDDKDEKFYMKAVQYKDLLTSWINSMAKPTALQRQARGIVSI